MQKHYQADRINGLKAYVRSEQDIPELKNASEVEIAPEKKSDPATFCVSK